MESELDKYYKEYEIVKAIFKEKLEKRDELYNSLIKTKVGKFYLSLNNKQKKEFRDIYSDTNIIRYFLNEKSIEIYGQTLKYLFFDVINSSAFPLNKETPLNIYIKDGIDTYNALTNKSTKDLNITDGVKIFIQEAISVVYGFARNITLDDISLIKVIYYKAKEKDSSKIIENGILAQVERIHKLDKNKLTYRENRRNFIVDLKDKIEKNETEIRNSDSGFKYLLLFSIETARYELALLEGKRVSIILKEIEESNMSESDKDYYKDALVKAYYNLTDVNFRKQSKYFSNNVDACYADFETADKEINKRLLKMMNR